MKLSSDRQPNSLVKKGLKCIFLGYSETHVLPTGILINLETGRIVTRALVDCFNWSDGSNFVRLKVESYKPENFKNFFLIKLRRARSLLH